MAAVLNETSSILAIHEIVSVFAAQGIPLSSKLSEMLNEHYSHQTERRGCGFTQATRVLAEFINQPRSSTEFDDLKLFMDVNTKPLRDLLQQAGLYGLDLNSWRNLDVNPDVQDFLQHHQTTPENHASQTFVQLLAQQVAWQHQLRHIHELLHREESLLWVRMLQDIILPHSMVSVISDQTTCTKLPVVGEKPKVGSCPMAEKFFLEIAHERIPRRGRVNVFTNAQQQPVLIEKLNMGDDHSCISLQPVCFNGVCLPAGSSFCVAYDADQISKTPAAHLAGDVMPLSECTGFWFLRLTTLAVAPPNRQRAFTTHFRQQIDNDLFSPDTTTLDQLSAVAHAQMGLR